MAKARFKRGDQIESLVQFADRLERRKPFYWRHKYLAAGFIEHWSVVMIKNSIKYGVLYCAEEKEDM